MLHSPKVPHTAVIHTNDSIILELDVPGSQAADVKIKTVTNSIGRVYLKMTGHRTYQQYEGSYKKTDGKVDWEQIVELPQNTNLEMIGSSLLDGVLTVNIPKTLPVEREVPLRIGAN